MDLEAAWRLVQEFDEPATVIIKHTNPCGVATGATLVESYQRALEVDPVSAFGSVIAFNRAVDGPTAEELSKLFVEAVVAPGFEAPALERLAAKKNLRLLDMSATAGDEFGLQIKVRGRRIARPNSRFTSGTTPTLEMRHGAPAHAGRDGRADICLAGGEARQVERHRFCARGVLVGVGAGQMSRVDSVKLAATRRAN